MYFSDFSNPYGPMKAHMGPARALEERGKFRKNFFLLTFIHCSVVVFLEDVHAKSLHTMLSTWRGTRGVWRAARDGDAQRETRDAAQAGRRLGEGASASLASWRTSSKQGVSPSHPASLTGSSSKVCASAR